MTFLRQIKSIRQSVWWLLMLLAMCSSTAWSAVGYVHEASGQVLAQRGTGAAQPVKAGDTFEPGTTFRTAGDGNVILKFEDGQLAALQPNTTFRVNQYNFIAAKPKESNSSISLIAGAMRFVTGIIGSTNHNNVKFTAGTTATIGIRGTDVTVQVNDLTNAVLAMIAAGAVALETPQGSVTINPGQFSTATPGLPPAAALPLAVAPANAQAINTALQKAPIPLNNAVIVESAAKAVTALVAARAAQATAAANPNNSALQEAAAKAVTASDAAIATAVSDATAVLQTAIQSGAVAPTPAGTPLVAQTATTTQTVNTIIAVPPPTPPPVVCTTSNC